MMAETSNAGGDGALNDNQANVGVRYLEEEVSSGFVNITEDVIENEYENALTINEEEKKIEEPKEGMEFDSIEELMRFYALYAKQKGFAVAKRTSKKVEGILTHVQIECTRGGTTRIKSSNPTKMRPNSKINCKAKINAFHSRNGKWCVKGVVLEHNHTMSPGNSRYYKSNRLLQPHVKKRLLMNDKAGIRVNKNFNALVVEAGGHENLSFIEKDVRNYISAVRRLQLGEGDANAMHNYFLKMQSNNSEFFYMMDLDDEGRLKNVFWADARSRAAFKEFGDVVTFDTTYLVNKYDMPFAPFVGVNHHGQSVLLGCGLISNEDTVTFTWLFRSWLRCMSDCPPNAIITDQDKAMKKAIECVFPNSRHRWCLWHIMKKLPEKLKGYQEYESIKYSMQNAVYESLSKEEFEDAWEKFIDKYQLQSNEWLLGLYDERNRWVPAFVKDVFWAGMSTTQRSESMHAFFDGYINSKTTLKQFVEQYENALAKKVENEKQEEFNSYNSSYPCATIIGLEKQFQNVYTRAKFKEFQNEMFGRLCCHLTVLGIIEVGFRKYEVRERVQVGERHKSATFKLTFNDATNEVNCNCRLFEFRGIMCRHQLMVYNEREIYDAVPAKYILKRWSKNVKRRHTKVRISYDNWSGKPEARRYDKMCNAFFELADVAADSDGWCDAVMEHINRLKRGFQEHAETCGSTLPVTTNINNESTSHGEGIVISKGSANILDPLVTRSKGRPPVKRKVGNVEKAVKKKARAKKKTSSSTYVQGDDDQVNEHGAQESFAIQPDIGVGRKFAIQPHIGDGGHLAFQPFIGVGGQFAVQPNIGDGGNLAFQPYMGIGGQFATQPNIGVGGQFGFQGYENPFWNVAHGFTSMQSSTLGMVQGQGNCTDGYEKDAPPRCSGDGN